MSLRFPILSSCPPRASRRLRLQGVTWSLLAVSLGSAALTFSGCGDLLKATPKPFAEQADVEDMKVIAFEYRNSPAVLRWEAPRSAVSDFVVEACYREDDCFAFLAVDCEEKKSGAECAAARPFEDESPARFSIERRQDNTLSATYVLQDCLAASLGLAEGMTLRISASLLDSRQLTEKHQIASSIAHRWISGTASESLESSLCSQPDDGEAEAESAGNRI